MRISIIIFFLPIFLFLLACRKPDTPGKKEFILDMVHHNPGEGQTKTVFSNPEKLHEYGYTGMVINNFKFINATISFHDFDSTLFPSGCAERQWMDSAALAIQEKIMDCHKAGIKAYAFMDIIVLPEKLVELYKQDLCDENGKISFQKSLTAQVHRIMLREVFERFPLLDGIVVRTGETYLFDVPYHIGNNPITEGAESHKKILEVLRDEVCVKLDRTVIYRTWDFGYFHVDPEYYLEVTDNIEPHDNLLFSIKHTKGDYHRTFTFNPTIGIGKHRQIIEVQAQREYEGKGAHPNYIMDGVINGFEEYEYLTGNKCLNDIKNNPLFAGIWSWSRGGGWAGPYITNELWCDLNTYVISAWAVDPERPEEEIFYDYAERLGLSDEDKKKFRELCLLSAKGVLRGRNSLVHNVNVWWTRDQFLGGLDELEQSFTGIIEQNLTDSVLNEKIECVEIWEKIVMLAGQIKTNDSTINDYLLVSARYGLIEFSIIEKAWLIMLKGMEGERNGAFDFNSIQDAIQAYDKLWNEYEMLKKDNPSCATLYQPYSFVFNPPAFRMESGMKESIDKYRGISFYSKKF